jgi:hypothetical protein
MLAGVGGYQLFMRARERRIAAPGNQQAATTIDG